MVLRLGNKKKGLKPSYDLGFPPWVLFSLETLDFGNHGFDKHFAAFTEKMVQLFRIRFDRPEYCCDCFFSYRHRHMVRK